MSQQEVPPTGMDDTQSWLTEDYLPLVHSIARGWRSRCRSSLDFADLVQSGCVGLAQAAQRYDPERHESFPAFAAERIRGAICDYLRSVDPLSRGRRRAVRELERARSALRQSLGREPRAQEVAASLGWAEREFELAWGDAAALERGWAVVREPLEEEMGSSEMLLAPQSADPHEEVIEQELRSELANAIQQLPEREQLVLSLYYEEQLTMQEVGEVLGITESRVSQIHSGAVALLRRALRARLSAPVACA